MSGREATLVKDVRHVPRPLARARPAARFCVLRSERVLWVLLAGPFLTPWFLGRVHDKALSPMESETDSSDMDVDVKDGAAPPPTIIRTKTALEFSSFSEADELQANRREDNMQNRGWRAPLWKQYAQLCSTSSDPLSLKRDVHLALARKPERRGAHHAAEMLVGGQRTELLTLGEAREGRIAKFGLARYSVMHDDPKANLFLFLESKDGDADIFVSRGDENPPTSTEYTWASAAMGSDEVLIRLDDPKFWTGAYQIAVYGGGGQKERVSFEIIARAYQPIGGIDARLYAPYSHSEAHTQGKRFLREVRQADFRRHRVKLGQPAADIMARRENPEPSTAPPTPTRRLLALEELGTRAALQMSHLLPASVGDVHKHAQLSAPIPKSQGGCRHLLRASGGETPPASGPGAGAPPTAAALPSADLMALNEAGTQAARELRFHLQAERFHASFHSRLALACEKHPAENGMVPVTSAPPPYPQHGIDPSAPNHIKHNPSLNPSWVSHVVARLGVPLVLPAGTRLWAKGEVAQYCVFVLSGELSPQPPPEQPDAAAAAATVLQAEVAAAPVPVPAGAALPPAPASSLARTSSSLTLERAKQRLSSIEEHKTRDRSTCFIAGDVVGDAWLIHAKRGEYRPTDLYAIGRESTCVLALPLEVLHKLRARERQAFEGLIRTIALASGAMPHLGEGSDEWATLTRCASRFGVPFQLGAAQNSRLKQTVVSLKARTDAIMQNLADLADQHMLDVEEVPPPPQPCSSGSSLDVDGTAAAGGAPTAAADPPSIARGCSSRFTHDDAPSPATTLAGRPMTAPGATAGTDGDLRAQSRGAGGWRPRTAASHHRTLSRASSRASASSYCIDSAPGGSAPLQQTVLPRGTLKSGMGAAAQAERLERCLSGTAADYPPIAGVQPASEEDITESILLEAEGHGPTSHSMAHSFGIFPAPSADGGLAPSMSVPLLPFARPGTPCINSTGMCLAASGIATQSSPSFDYGTRMTKGLPVAVPIGEAPPSRSSMSRSASASAIATEFFRRRDAEAGRRLEKTRRRIERRAQEDGEGSRCIGTPALSSGYVGGASGHGALAAGPPQPSSSSTVRVLAPPSQPHVDAATGRPRPLGPTLFQSQPPSTPSATVSVPSMGGETSSAAPHGHANASQLRRLAQQQYFNILADLAVRVDEQMQRPNPRAIVRRDRARREDERREAEERKAQRVAEMRERAALEAASTLEAAAAKASSAAGGGSATGNRGRYPMSSPTTERPQTAQTVSSLGDRSGGGVGLHARAGTAAGARPSTAGGQSVTSRASADNTSACHATGPATAAQPQRVTSSVQQTRMALTVSSFNQARRSKGVTLLQDLDQRTDERLQRFQRLRARSTS